MPITEGGHTGQLVSLVVPVGVFLLNFLLFVLPGFATASLISHRFPKRTVQIVIVVATVTATLGYLSFWIFFFNKLLGRIFSFVVYIAAGVICCKKDGRKLVLEAISAPFGYAALIGAFYLCLFFLFANPLTSGGYYADTRYFEQVRPPDNVIPLIFAERIYSRQPLRPFCCGNWLSSDRPPLQSGIYLLELHYGLCGKRI
jgi:hypothetical protein